MDEMLVQGIFKCILTLLAALHQLGSRSVHVLWRNVTRDNVIYALPAAQPAYIRPQTAHKRPQIATKMLFCLNSPGQALYPK